MKGPAKIFLVQGHPDPSNERLCDALASAYLEGAESVGAEVRVFDIGQVDFPFLRTKAEWGLGVKGTPDQLTNAQDNLLWMDQLTLFYPLWLGTMPAITKAFFEQVLRPGVALRESQTGLPKKLLCGRSARIVVTMGMPVLAYRWYFRAHSLKNLERNILKFCGITPIHETLFGMVESVSPGTRRKWIENMRKIGERDGRQTNGKRKMQDHEQRSAKPQSVHEGTYAK